MWNQLPALAKAGGAMSFAPRIAQLISTVLFAAGLSLTTGAWAADTLSKIRDSQTITFAYRETPHRQ